MTTIRLNGPNTTSASVINFAQRLGGIDLRFRLQWMVSQEYWVITVSNENDEGIINTARLIEGNDIFKPYSDTRLPTGRLILHDTSNLHEEPGRFDLRNRHILVYTDQPVIEEDTEFDVEPTSPPYPPPPPDPLPV